MHAVKLVVLTLLGCVAAGAAYPRNVVQVLNVSNGGPWGDWGIEEFCPKKTYAKYFKLQVELPCGCDNSALNGIYLYCKYKPGEGTRTYEVWSSIGKWGQLNHPGSCEGNDFMVSFRFDVEPNRGSGDDTAANNVDFRCQKFSGKYSTPYILEGNSPAPWGSIQEWSSECPDKSAICGLQTKLEPDQGSGDDSAINDVRMFCCDD